MNSNSQNFCSECGSKISPGEKFCKNCGKKIIINSVKEEKVINKIKLTQNEQINKNTNYVNQNKPITRYTHESEYTNNRYKYGGNKEEYKKRVAKMQRRNNRIGWIVAVAALVLCVIGFLFLVGCSIKDTSSNDKVLDINVSKKILPSEEKQSINLDNNITVELPAFAIDKEAEFKIKSVDGGPEVNATIHNILGTYDITLGDYHEFTGNLVIDIPYDSRLLVYDDPEKAIEAFYFDETNGQWEYVPCTVDNNSVTLYMNHLTEVTIVESTSKKIRYPSSISDFINSEFSSEDMIAYAKYAETQSEAKIIEDMEKLGWSTALNAYGITGVSTTFMEEVLDLGQLGDANNVMKQLGVATTLIQYSAQAYDGDKLGAMTTGTKGFMSFAIAHWGGTALNIASIGMFAIDYSLSELSTVYTDSYEDYKEKYQEYYNTQAKRSFTEWYKILWKKVENATSVEEFEDEINKELDSYVKKIWNDDFESAGFVHVKDDHRAEYEKAFKASLYEMLSKNVFLKLRDNLENKIIDANLEAKYKAKRFLESPLTIYTSMTGGNKGDKVKVEIYDDNTKILEGPEVAIEDLAWGSEITRFRFTMVDYIDKGMPKIVKATLTDKNGNVKTKTKKGVLKTSGKGYGLEGSMNVSFKFETNKENKKYNNKNNVNDKPSDDVDRELLAKREAKAKELSNKLLEDFSKRQKMILEEHEYGPSLFDDIDNTLKDIEENYKYQVEFLNSLLNFTEEEKSKYDSWGVNYNQEVERVSRRVNEYFPQMYDFISKYADGYNQNNPEHLKDYEQLEKLAHEIGYWTGNVAGISWLLGQLGSYNYCLEFVPNTISLLESRLSTGITEEEYKKIMEEFRYNKPWDMGIYYSVEDIYNFLLEIGN